VPMPSIHRYVVSTPWVRTQCLRSRHLVTNSNNSFARQVADGAAPRESLAGAYERAVTAATPRAASNADLIGEMQPTYNSLKMQLLPG